MDFEEFVRRAEKGEILIGIEPAHARKFYTDYDPAKILEATGYDSRAGSLLVKTVWIAEGLSLLAGIVLSVPALRWYCLAAIPAMLFLFLLLGSRASMGPVRLRGAVVLQLAAPLVAFALREHGLLMMGWCILLPTPFLFAKLTYYLAVHCLREASVESERLYTMLLGTTFFVREDTFRL